MRLEDALRFLLEREARPVTATETVPLAAALGRVLADDLIAPRDLPPHPNSAVDGYAVRHAVLAADGETTLPVAGRIAAGDVAEVGAMPEAAWRIFTGAAVPAGLDTVVMQENTRRDGDRVTLPAGVHAGVNVRPAGEDVAAGTVALPRGRVLRPWDMGLAAATGRDRLAVFRRPRAAVFSTGDEIREPGPELPPGKVFDANRYALGALLRGLGIEVTDLGILPDDPAAIRVALAAAARCHDVLLTSGGVSMGEEDHVKGVVESLGSLTLWRLAIRPGRPVALGRIGEALFAGLPGNPVAALITALRVLRPLLLAMAGRTDITPRFRRVAAGFAFRKKLGRREWLRARLEDRPGADPVAVKFRAEGSALLTSMTFADGLVELPEDAERIAEGEAVDFLPFAEVLQ